MYQNAMSWIDSGSLTHIHTHENKHCAFLVYTLLSGILL